MAEHDYKYDVAFSFLSEDEEMATQINDLIQDRVKTFIYSRKQDELAGTDGEQTFNRVFGTEAMTVFVLYRKGWGETSWTRIEETAIRNRAFEEGYDFVLFAPLDKPTAVPKWLPKNRIWIGIDRWGIEGVASVIESRIQNAGGIPKEETVEERAARLNRDIDFGKKKKDFIKSERGVKSADKEIMSLFSEIEEIVKRISEKETNLSLKIERNHHVCLVYGSGHTLQLLWRSRYSNTVEDAKFYIKIWKGWLAPPKGRYLPPIEEPREIKSREFKFDIIRSDKKGWCELFGKKRFFTSIQVAHESINALLDIIHTGINSD